MSPSVLGFAETERVFFDELHNRLDVVACFHEWTLLPRVPRRVVLWLRFRLFLRLGLAFGFDRTSAFETERLAVQEDALMTLGAYEKVHPHRLVAFHLSTCHFAHPLTGSS